MFTFAGGGAKLDSNSSEGKIPARAFLACRGGTFLPPIFVLGNTRLLQKFIAASVPKTIATAAVFLKDKYTFT
jgi:hypothetical protein